MNKTSIALLTLILANCQAHSMQSPYSRFAKTIKSAERLTLALKVLNYGICGYIGWNLGSFMTQNNKINQDEIKQNAYEEGRKEGFLEGKCNEERILWNYWRRTEYGNLHGFSDHESKKWQAQRDKAGQAYFDCRKQSEELARNLIKI